MSFISLILFNRYYITYIFLKLLCQLYQLKHIQTLLIHSFHFLYIICIISFDIYYIDYLHYLILYQLCWLIHSNWNKWYNAYNWYNRTYILHSMLQFAFNPIGLHYILRDQHEAHKLTNYILHPSPEPSLQSPGAPGKRLLMLWGMVPVSPTGTRGSFPRILSTRELVSCSRARKGPWNR